MRALSRPDVIHVLASGILLVLPATSRAQQRPPIAEEIAKTYGLDSFGQVEAIRTNLRKFIGEHDYRVADLDFGVANSAIGLCYPHPLGR